MDRRMWFGRAAVVLAAALLAGCATLPSPEQMRQEVANFALPKSPAPDKAMIYVVRPSGLGGIVRFNVFLNDKEDASEMGFTRASQYIYFNVPAGKTVIYSKAENWAELEVVLKPGEVAFVQQDPSFGIIMARNSLQRLSEIEGKYQVKNLTVGTIHKVDK